MKFYTGQSTSVIIICLSLRYLRVYCAPVSSTPTPNGPTTVPADEAVIFMKRFGYLDPAMSNLDTIYEKNAITEAIKTVQKFGDIPQTGKLDAATQKLMKSKRCGVPDIIRSKRPKRYIVGSEGWKKRNITFFVANWTPKIGEENVVNEMQKAFNSWSGYARLNFQHVQDPNADIIIGFGRGPHGDLYPFDGPGNILAHAYFPYEHGAYGGDIHFDDDEEWMVHPGPLDSGVDFFTVAVHELGHSLGLAHSPVSGSIMFPYYKGYQPNFQLDYDDILAMYELYISQNLEGDVIIDTSKDEEQSQEETDETELDAEESDCTDSNSRSSTCDSNETTSEIPTTTNDDHIKTDMDDTDGGTSLDDFFPSPTPEYNITFVGDDENIEDHIHHDKNTTPQHSTPNLCNGKFDAIALLRNELFIFKDTYIWRLSEENKVLQDYPVPIRQFFWALPENVKRIDSIYQRETDQSIILFTGNKFWVYNGDHFIEDSPKPLSYYGLPQSLTKVDASFVWGKNGKTFFFSGNKYWRYNDSTRQMDPTYPHDISRWRGVPDNIDAAMTWKDGLTYFFKNNLFWRFNNHLIKSDKEYPKSISQDWLQCSQDYV